MEKAVENVLTSKGIFFYTMGKSESIISCLNNGNINTVLEYV